MLTSREPVPIPLGICFGPDTRGTEPQKGFTSLVPSSGLPITSRLLSLIYFARYHTFFPRLFLIYSLLNLVLLPDLFSVFSLHREFIPAIAESVMSCLAASSMALYNAVLICSMASGVTLAA
ncbi:hypothetical protein LWI28_001568 [Acer negundo]|uniref:Uncharacterized protein n=1 Tax=Acer negundo TaxID=4023 RepID=A0AAD5J9D2_ACENE|nr:hypothetical protein LWI28_001568 [Acer negundo]